jgi:hypothetical protein
MIWSGRSWRARRTSAWWSAWSRPTAAPSPATARCGSARPSSCPTATRSSSWGPSPRRTPASCSPPWSATASWSSTTRPASTCRPSCACRAAASGRSPYSTWRRIIPACRYSRRWSACAPCSLATGTTRTRITTDTRITLTPAQRRRFPPGHDKDGDEVPHWDLASLEACGALRSTAHDQLTFLAANLGLTPTPLLPALRASHAPRRDTDLPGQKVALGWHVQPLRRGGKATLVWHNGGTGGSRCFLGFVPEARVGAVILNNSDHSVDALTIELLRRLSPAE